MKVFVSSVITGLEEFRDAVSGAIRILGHSAIRAEDFGASPATPQTMCLDGVREADVVVLILGQRYGHVQQNSGISATHEEYAEARQRCPVLAFIQDEVEFEPQQESFISEVQSWDSGHYTSTFHTPDDLRDLVIRALHDLELSMSRGLLDAEEPLNRALAYMSYDRHQGFGMSPQLCIAMVGAPKQSILSPSQIESPGTIESVLRTALLGPNSVLAVERGTKTQFDNDSIIISQHGADIRLTEEGSIVFTGELPDDGSYLPVIVEEDIVEMIKRFIQFGIDILAEFDATNRLSHCVVATTLMNAEHHAWRTRKENSQNSNSVSLPFNVRLGPVYLSPPERPRQTLKLLGSEIATDLMVKLRRQLRSGL